MKTRAALSVQPACPRWPSQYGRRGIDRNPLLAVRRASWPLRHALIRSHTFSDALGGAARIEAELTPLAQRLVDVIYARVPQASGPERRKLLAIKRAAFNHEPLPEAYRELAAGGLVASADDLHRYQGLVAGGGQRAGWDREAVLGELRQALSERTSPLDFRLALNASSPALSASLRRRESVAAPLSARQCRGLYAYVCRFTTKANPLHVFADVIPGPGMSDGAAGETEAAGVVAPAKRCEVVFGVDAMLAIERRLLAGGIDADRLRLALRPLFRKDGRWQVLLKRDNEWCAAFLPELAVLGHLRSLYDEQRDAGVPVNFTRAELERALSGRLRGEAGEAGASGSAIDRLIALGVLEPYAIEDLWSPSKNLGGVKPAADRLLACVDRWHLADVDIQQLPEIDRELSSAREDCPDLLPDGVRRYHVNAYAAERSSEAEQAARELVEPLRELRPLLTVESGFSPHERLIRAFLADELSDGVARPYLDLLSIYLRRKAEILNRFRAQAQPRDYDAIAHHAWTWNGQVEREELRELARRHGSSQDAPICVAGPFDFAARRLFLSNVFAGDRTSVARFRLARRYQAMPAPEPMPEADANANAEPPLDVELAVAPESNLNFVVRCFDVGCGFDRRWAHGYRQWIEPQEIDVRLERGTPIYVHARTGRRLRFRFAGLLVARFLPIEYQLLLLDHAGGYRNPFLTEAPGKSPDAIEHRQGLWFGRVCLRRECWVVPASMLRTIVGGRDVLAATAALHRFVHERLAPHALWFYHQTGVIGRRKKPRFLDVESPLSTMVLRHALRHRASHVTLSPMAPGMDGAWRTAGEGHFAELMVEA